MVCTGGHRTERLYSSAPVNSQVHGQIKSGLSLGLRILVSL